MRVLISGASGFIGRALVSELTQEGHQVHPIVRRPAHAGEAQLDLRSRHLDLSQLPGGQLRGIEAVFNLAGEPLTARRWGPAKRERIVESRVQTTRVIAATIAATESPPAVFVSMSATGYYGERGEEILDEQATAGTGFLAECCRAWEAAAAQAKDRGIRVVTMRSAVALGPGGGALATQLPLFRLGLGARLGSGRQWMSWIALADLVQALIFAATNPQLSGPTNLSAPNPVRNAEFTAALAQAVHRHARLAVPRSALVVALGKRVADEFLLASQRVLPAKLTQAGFSFRLPLLEGALQAAIPPSRRAHGR